nr:hypothetical protein [Aestuariivivens sediminis]
MGLNWYGATARNYDSAIGRWMNLRPLAEKMRRHSSYNQAVDNPIYWIDPDGISTDDFVKLEQDGSFVWVADDDTQDVVDLSKSLWKIGLLIILKIRILFVSGSLSCYH